MVKIKRIDVDFPILITLSFNHLKWNLSQKNDQIYESSWWVIIWNTNWWFGDTICDKMFRWQNLRPFRICWINDDVIRRLWTNHNPCLSINISSIILSKSRGQISTPTQPFKSWLCSWARRFKTFEKRYFQISAFRKRVEIIFILELRIKLKTSVVVRFCSGQLTKTLFSAPF